MLEPTDLAALDTAEEALLAKFLAPEASALAPLLMESMMPVLA